MKKIIALFVFFSVSTITYAQDTDLDGLDDLDEINGTYGFTSNPNESDTDFDGLNDFNEVMGINPQSYASNPNFPDSDGDGLNDLDEVYASFSVYSNPLLSDTDGDGLTDYEEAAVPIIPLYFSNPNLTDTDSDGLSDYDEVMGINTNGYTSNPSDADTDNGTVEDGDEIIAGLDPNDPSDDGCLNDMQDPIPDLPVLLDVIKYCKITSLSPPGASDNCSHPITITHNAVLPITVEGTIVVTWTYEDASGNKTTQNQNVILNSTNFSETTSFINDITIVADQPVDSYIWINCVDLQPVSGATGQQFTATENGSYAVIATYGSCSDTSDCQIIDKVSLNENNSLVEIGIYPNPSKDGKFNIDYSGVINSIKLYDMTGKEKIIVYNQLNMTQIDCSKMESGKYIILFELPTGVVTEELVITK